MVQVRLGTELRMFRFCLVLEERTPVSSDLVSSPIILCEESLVNVRDSLASIGLCAMT